MDGEPANLILRADQNPRRNIIFSCFLISLLYEAFLTPVAAYSALNSHIEIITETPRENARLSFLNSMKWYNELN